MMLGRGKRPEVIHRGGNHACGARGIALRRSVASRFARAAIAAPAQAKENGRAKKQGFHEVTIAPESEKTKADGQQKKKKPGKTPPGVMVSARADYGAFVEDGALVIGGVGALVSLPEAGALFWLHADSRAAIARPNNAMRDSFLFIGALNFTKSG
jgi:hypothetical protein